MASVAVAAALTAGSTVSASEREREAFAASFTGSSSFPSSLMTVQRAPKPIVSVAASSGDAPLRQVPQASFPAQFTIPKKKAF